MEEIRFSSKDLSLTLSFCRSSSAARWLRVVRVSESLMFYRQEPDTVSRSNLRELNKSFKSIILTTLFTRHFQSLGTFQRVGDHEWNSKTRKLLNFGYHTNNNYASSTSAPQSGQVEAAEVFWGAGPITRNIVSKWPHQEQVSSAADISYTLDAYRTRTGVNLGKTYPPRFCTRQSRTDTQF